MNRLFRITLNARRMWPSSKAGALLVFLLLALGTAGSLHAQFTKIGNQFISAYVVTEPAYGRFYMTSGPALNDVRFLYGGSIDFVTSNIVFRIESGGNFYYYCNTPNQFGFRPAIGGAGTNYVPFKAFDSLYLSTDTMAMGYKGMNGFDVTVRLIPEKVTSQYARGADMLIEFSVKASPFSPPGKVGIFMMLDGYNGQADGTGGSGDRSSVLTNRGYFPQGNVGKRYELPFDTIPDWYHVGNFTMDRDRFGNLNTTLPLHRLTGTSHNGTPLTTPQMFAVGDWRSHMRDYSWDALSTDVGTVALNDCATAMRWTDLTGGMTVRTAFGTNNREGNDMFHCRDSGLFVDIQTERVVEQKVKNGVYTPTSFDVNVWVTNLDLSLPKDVQLVIDTPILSDKGPNRLLLDPSTPASQSYTIKQAGQRKYRWRLNFNPAYSDDSAVVQLGFRYKVPNKAGPRLFKDLCSPKITIKRYADPVPPPVDTVAPAIIRGAPYRSATMNFPFATQDQHNGYIYDTGIDRIVVEANDNNNFAFPITPPNFKRCDTTIRVNMLASVIDTSRAARIVFAVYDCRNNVRRDSALFNPRPDIFAPEVVRIDSSGSYGPLCNHRQYDVHLIDSANQRPDAGDNGFGMITVIGTPLNFKPIEVNFDRGGVAIGDFDKLASFRLEVIDTLYDASAIVRVADYAGNSDTLTFNYCTLPDIERPRTNVVPTSVGPTKSWDLFASDTLPWDRGLESVVVLDNPGNNVLVNLPSVLLGQRTADWSASVIDDRIDASVVFEVRDLQYLTTPAGHADTVTLRYSRIADTLAPNIIYTPVNGSSGATADVEVNDIHYFGPVLYKFDLGLATVRVVSISPNMRLVTPITFSAGDSVTTFRIQVIDTLSFGIKDSICLEAIDLAGNRSELCYYYPINPDSRSPIFIGTIDRAAGGITATVSDNRLYDRGLGSISLEDGVNLDAGFTTVTYNGTRTTPFSISITDQLKTTSGVLVIRDLVGLLDSSAESQALHSVRVPFLLPVVSIKLKLPELVEPTEAIRGAIIVADTISVGGGVEHFTFEVNYTGAGVYSSAVQKEAVMTATPSGNNLLVDCRLDTTRTYQPGDTLGYLIWNSQGARTVGQFTAKVDKASLVVNDGMSRTITIPPRIGDTAVSVLIIPAPLPKITADSTTYVNGECERFLTTHRGAAGKLTGLAILGVRPNPVGANGSSTIEVDLRDLPQQGGRIEFVTMTGDVVSAMLLDGVASRVSRFAVPVPATLPSGLYMMRVIAGDEGVWTKVVVVR